jgi:hypothetical protein
VESKITLLRPSERFLLAFGLMAITNYLLELAVRSLVCSLYILNAHDVRNMICKVAITYMATISDFEITFKKFYYTASVFK